MTVLQAAAVVTPSGVLRPGAVELEGDRIVAVGPTRGEVPERILAPGFVDLQVNGIDAVDVAAADGTDWDLLDALLLAQGVTSWCPTLVTSGLDTYDAPLRRIAGAARRSGPRPTIAGAHLEGPFLGGAPGAHRKEYLRPLDLDWLAHLPGIVRLVTLAPELDAAPAAVELLTRRGVVVSMGHSTATAAQAAAAVDAGARMVTHLFNGMGPLHHREPGLLALALADERVTACLIADGIHVHPLVLKAAFACKGPSRTVLVTDAVAWRAHSGRLGRVALVDGAPRLADGTLAGSALTMPGALRTVTKAGVPLPDAMAAASTNPARLLGLDDRGRLEPGARGDVVALTPGLDVEAVWVGGEPAYGVAG